MRKICSENRDHYTCSDINRHKCPNLQKAEPAIVLRDNDTGSDALTQ
jgi:hypothetical protein